MKNKIKSKSIINILGTGLIAMAGIISYSSCFGFLGEPTPPKSLLK
ncbi:cyclic lactone autoinducer peptide [Clostridium gasigenes]|nr:cyclic lactone autoinducer peptide [Clostridium gasigenes]MBB6622438.1 cyclic lactone autoinducer peptide [Clostridium gasigenes]